MKTDYIETDEKYKLVTVKRNSYKVPLSCSDLDCRYSSDVPHITLKKTQRV